MKTKTVLSVALLAALVAAPVVQAQFVWDETSPMVYDGAGVDIAINPYTQSTSDGDINITSSLTVQSGSLTINPATPWGDKIGNAATGSVIVNGGILNWVVDNDGEDRLMVGNGVGGNATVTLDGGNFNVTGPGGYNHAEQNVRFGSDGAVCTMNLLNGTLDITIAIPVAFGGKWINTGTTWTEGAGVSVMNIGDGSFVVSGGGVFGVGSNDDINFASTGTGKLSINGWNESQFAALATAGKLQIDGVDVSDLSGFAFTTEGSQGVLAIPEPATIGLVSIFGIGTLFVRRRLMM